MVKSIKTAVVVLLDAEFDLFFLPETYPGRELRFKEDES